MIKETDYAWAAGVIDGEGHIGIRVQAPRKSAGGVSLSFTQVLQIVMTHKLTIDRLYDIFNHTGSIKVVKPRQINARVQYGWTVADKQLMLVLDRTVPYLITKKDQANLIIEYRKSCCPAYGGRRCSLGLVERRLEIYRQITELNAKGKDPAKHINRVKKTLEISRLKCIEAVSVANLNSNVKLNSLLDLDLFT